MASNSKKKLKIIDYTDRDFDSIKSSLVGYAKRYYPDSFKDFNDAGFGALVLDSVAYVGDILSYYLDYQVNESFLDTATEYNNVVRIARQLGYKYTNSSTAIGEAQIYATVPADSTGAPDSNYYPTLRAGSQFSAINGSLFTLVEDLYFGNPNNEILVSTVNPTTNVPTGFAIKATGKVISGRVLRETTTIGGFQKFLQVPLTNPNATEIISVVDTEGHVYYEVDHLSQEIIYKSIRNTNSDQKNAPSILKAVPAVRRFVLERTRGSAYLQFGYGSDSELTNESVVDPSKIVLKVHGRDYTTEQEFDPTNLTSTDKFGVAPADTILTISYRVNEADDVNIASNTLTKVVAPRLEFENQGSLDVTKRRQVRGSLEVNNTQAILGDVSLPSTQEIKQRVFSYYATQNRAVTPEDYQAITYAMPPSYGSVKRCVVLRDFDSFKRNLNLHVISENSNKVLTTTSSTIKENLKTWLTRYKVINDTIDIRDTIIVNFGIEFILITDYSENKFNALNLANARLRNYFVNNRFDIGESLYISEIYKELQKVPNVIDVLDVKIIPKNGGVYSDISFDFNLHLSSDGRYVTIEPDAIFELKFPDVDVQGSIV